MLYKNPFHASARLLLIACAAALVTACSGGSQSESPIPIPGTTTPNQTQRALTRGVVPLPASAFTDSVGVGMHLAYQGSKYDTGYATWSAILMKSGIKHVRDGLCSYGARSSWCTQTWAPRVKQLGSAGIRMDVVWDPRNCWTGNCGSTPTSVYASTLGISADVDAYEGPNECDVSNLCPASGYSGGSWQKNMPGWMQDLMSLGKSPSVMVYGPAMAHDNDYGCCGNLAASMNYGSIHDYPGASWPEEGYVPAWKSGASAVSGSDPIVSTETGYNTDPTYTNQGVSQLDQERLTPRILFTHLYYGIKRTYLYELFDEGTPGSGYMYGLLNGNFTPKPVWTRLMQLLGYFADSGTSPRTPLAYSLTGDRTGKLYTVLFQKSNGYYILVPWLGTQQWNTSGNSDIAPTSETLTLSLPSAVSSITVKTFGDHGTTTVKKLSGTSGKFSLPVGSLIEAVSFRT